MSRPRSMPCGCWSSPRSSEGYEVATAGSAVGSAGACGASLTERIRVPTSTAPKAKMPAATQKATV